MAYPAIGKFAFYESAGCSEGPKFLPVICGVGGVFREEQMLRERGAAGEQVEARPAWPRVPERRAIREGNEGLAGDLRESFKELCFLRTSIPFFLLFLWRMDWYSLRK